MDLEFHQIELRYESLRRRAPARERQILASLDTAGQACPVVVLASKGTPPFILLDDYKRLRALNRLNRDTVRATLWDMDEAEALVLIKIDVVTIQFFHSWGRNFDLGGGWRHVQCTEVTARIGGGLAREVAGGLIDDLHLRARDRCPGGIHDCASNRTRLSMQ